MDDDSVERIFNLVQKENNRMNEVLEEITEKYGDSGAVSLCLNLGINLLAHALLVVGEENQTSLLLLMASEAADRVKVGVVRAEADAVIRKAKGEV